MNLFGFLNFEYDFVNKYLAKNLMNYTELGPKVRDKVNFNVLPYGTKMYSFFGDKFTKDSGGHVYVLPSESKVTKEAIPWMREGNHVYSNLQFIWSKKIV